MALTTRHKNPHRPYAERKNRGKYPPSVTTIQNAMGTGDGLLHWVARIGAAYVADYPFKLEDLVRDDVYDKMSKLWLAERAAAAERGTIVHAVNEAWTDGEEPDIAELVNDAANREKAPITQWQGREAFIVAEIDRYVDALEKFWVDFEPVTVGSEEVVLHDNGSHSFIGQRDWTATLKGFDGVSLIDLKTIDKQVTDREPFKGIYLEKYRLQIAAYRGAKELLVFDADGNEIERKPSYPINNTFVLALRSDGTYQLVEVQAGGDEFAHFLRLIDLHHWVTKGSKKPAPIDRTIDKEKEVAA